MEIWGRPGFYYPIPSYRLPLPENSARYSSAQFISYLRCTCECYCDKALESRAEALHRVRRIYDMRALSDERTKDINHDVFSVVKPGRRNRTTYKRWQIEELERAFLINPYPTSVFKKTLALRLGLRDSRVQVWFQNRRAKSKRDRQSCPSPVYSPTTFDHESDNHSTCADDIEQDSQSKLLVVENSEIENNEVDVDEPKETEL